MLIPHTVNARLVERFIFNFRVRPEVLTSHLPVAYLRPQVFYGWSVVSFCILKLDRVMFSPLPSLLDFKTISCAYRCGVTDTSGGKPVPSVYIPERYTDLSMISLLGPWIFSDTILKICPAITREGAVSTIRVHHLDRQCMFSAEAKPSANPRELSSRIFDSIDSFAHFINSGVSSYTPAIYGDALARVDLHKNDTHYEALNATVEYSSLGSLWRDAGLTFDSAVRATGGLYKWTYRGLVERSYSNTCR